MNDKNNREELLQTLETFPERLTRLVTNLSEEQLEKTYGEGKWTIRQVVNHLAESHINGFIRLKFILTEDNPTLVPYQEPLWAEIADTKSMPVDITLLILIGLHKRIIYLLRSLTEEQWQRTAYHPDEGELDINWWLKAYANHGEKHLGHIKQGLERYENQS